MRYTGSWWRRGPMKGGKGLVTTDNCSVTVFISMTVAFCRLMHVQTPPSCSNLSNILPECRYSNDLQTRFKQRIILGASGRMSRGCSPARTRQHSFSNFHMYVPRRSRTHISGGGAFRVHLKYYHHLYARSPPPHVVTRAARYITHPRCWNHQYFCTPWPAASPTWQYSLVASYKQLYVVLQSQGLSNC